MTTPDNTQNTNSPSASPRPFGFWLKVIDRRLDEAMRDLFAEEGITRRDWRRLNLVAGTVTDPRMSEKLAARPERVEPLVERGWVEGEPGAREPAAQLHLGCISRRPLGEACPGVQRLELSGSRRESQRASARDRVDDAHPELE